MNGRSRRHRRANVKIAGGLVLVAATVAAAAVALIAASHGPTLAAQPASFNAGVGHHSRSVNEWGLMNSAANDSGGLAESSLMQLASVNQQTFSQTTKHGRTLDMQRGVAVFASKHFLILRSKNGSLHLWVLSRATKFVNASTTTASPSASASPSPSPSPSSTSPSSTSASSTSATTPAADDTNPLVSLFEGDGTAGQSMMTPSAQPESATVQVPGTDLTVTVTITENTANVAQTGTMPATGSSVADPATMTESAWMTAGSKTDLTRGDLVMVVGTRSHGLLHADIVLYMPQNAGDATPSPTPSPSVSVSVSASPTPSPSASPSPIVSGFPF
jgi:hypothetical protein